MQLAGKAMGVGEFLKRCSGKSMSLSSDVLNLNVECFLKSVGNRKIFTLNDKVKKN